MNEMPTIRVEFESMKHSMLTAINQHLDEISKVAESHLEELLSDKNFLANVRTQIELMARQTIAQGVEKAISREVEKHIDVIVQERYKKLWEDLYPPAHPQEEEA